MKSESKSYLPSPIFNQHGELFWTQQALLFAVWKEKDFFKKARFAELLDWPTRAEDFRLFDQVKKIINLDLPDTLFAERVATIEFILKDSVLFQKLQSPALQVSPHHNNTRPATHTLDVLSLVESNGLDPEIARAVRWAAFFHDFGKLFGAAGPESKYHPVLSSFLAYEYLYDNVENISDLLKQKLLFVIQYHHSLEEYAHGRIDDIEIRNRLNDDQTSELMYLLVKADLQSLTKTETYLQDLETFYFLNKIDVYQRLAMRGVILDGISWNLS